MAYKLSYILYGHSLDVRALAVTADGCLVSTSRDKTARIWKPNAYGPGYTAAITLRGHTSFVSSVCTLHPFPNYPDGLILTGGCDNIICAFYPHVEDPIFVLQGHKDNVCCVNPGCTSGFVLSSSWDKTAKLWSVVEQKCILTLSGHESSVWSVVQLTSGLIVTGSADKTIRVYFPDGKHQRTLTGHSDCVRGLAAFSDSVFLSCSNDATIRKWNAHTGECLQTLYGHQHYIYSVSVLGEHVVSGGEDRTVRLWHEHCPQEIMLPVQSIWAVVLLHNFDIAVGSSDGVIRLFSAEPSRQADTKTIAKYEDEVSKFGKSMQDEIGGVKVSDLPGREALLEPGRADGQTKMIREGAKVTCYSWSQANGEWTKVGDVTGSKASEGKTLYGGKEYDFVFNVDIEDGKPPLKLPYNNGEDPWFVAQEFIHKHNLSQQFLEQIANFIITNSKQETAPSSNNQQQYVDPFTGGARYIPGGSSVGSSGNSTADPFTGGARYIPGSQATPASNSNIPRTDPFTGGARYVPNASQSQFVPDGTAENEAALFPQVPYVRFDQANLQAIREKLEELNSKSGDSSRQLQSSSLDDVVKLGNLGLPVFPQALQSLQQLLEWPQDIVFPVLDITRLAVRNEEINKALCSSDSGEYLLTVLRKYLVPEALPANQMLALRIVTNMMCHKPGENLVMKEKHLFLFIIRKLANRNATKNLQVALATLLLNLSVAFVRFKDIDCQREAVATLSLIMPTLTESESVLRGLVALGTLLENNRELQEELSPEAKDRLHTIAKNTSDSGMSKAVSCASKILRLIK